MHHAAIKAKGLDRSSKLSRGHVLITSNAYADQMFKQWEAVDLVQFAVNILLLGVSTLIVIIGFPDGHMETFAICNTLDTMLE